jgi:hypothetical protein
MYLKKNEYNKNYMKLLNRQPREIRPPRADIVVAPRQQPALADGADRAANVPGPGQVRPPREASVEAPRQPLVLVDGAARQQALSEPYSHKGRHRAPVHKRSATTTTAATTATTSTTTSTTSTATTTTATTSTTASTTTTTIYI